MEVGDLIYIPASVSMCGIDKDGVPAGRSICTSKPAVVLVVSRSNEKWVTVAMDGRLWSVRPENGTLLQKGDRAR